MYSMDVKVSGKWLSIKELQEGLSIIHKDVTKRGHAGNPMHKRVQILTSDKRTTWALNRRKLENGKFLIQYCILITRVA